LSSVATPPEAIAATADPRPPASSPATSVWIYRPWLDLLVGCGAWSAPLLAIATWLTPSHSHAWGVAFYALALIFNYPHFMATVYRAYHSRADFEKYKIFTLHFTLLMIATGVLLHASYRLLPWVFTLYICWSPWHYTGQNYGLLMMFARRAGAPPTPGERQWLHGAFVASYLMLLASFETGGSGDPLVLSLGFPAKFTLPMRLALGGVFAVFSSIAFRGLIRRAGLRAMAAPLTLAVTQFLWFVLPTLLELRADYHVPQTRYSSGILAVLHSAQYLWITSYYQRREARAAGQSDWRVAVYFLTLIAGGIALFIPGPWLVSRLLRFDFSTSFLIFTAVVNIHHFILDGALWKLRDSRIASFLIERTPGATTAGAPSGQPAAWRPRPAPAFGIALAVLLFLWGALDQVHFALGTNDASISALQRAAAMNPYDGMLQARLASAEAKVGHKEEALAAYQRAAAVSPHNAALQHAYARSLLEAGRYSDAYAFYQKMLAIFPHDTDALLNYGLLATRLGHPDEAIDSWERAVTVDPNLPLPNLYLAGAFERDGEYAAASRHWESYLRFAATHPTDPAVTPAQETSAAIQLADDQSRLGHADAGVAGYLSAIALAERAGDAKLKSLALAHLGDLQEKTGDPKAAAQSYVRGLAIDEKAGDPRSAASDWFNFGQFLRNHRQPGDLAYACFLKAEELLTPIGGSDLETVRATRVEFEATLGGRAAADRKNLPALLARAMNLPAGAFDTAASQPPHRQ
jgi:tetratricopeptide (TPR) repeat protein